MLCLLQDKGQPVGINLIHMQKHNYSHILTLYVLYCIMCILGDLLKSKIIGLCLVKMYNTSDVCIDKRPC